MITAGATPTPKTIDQRRVALTSPQVKTLQTDNAGTLGPWPGSPRNAQPNTMTSQPARPLRRKTKLKQPEIVRSAKLKTRLRRGVRHRFFTRLAQRHPI